MNRFALFAGDAYYPVGGFDDFVLSGTLEECKARFSRWSVNGEAREFDWAHIADLEAMKIVCVADGGDGLNVVWRDPYPDPFA